MNETVVSRMYVTLALHVVLTTQEFVSVALTSGTSLQVSRLTINEHRWRGGRGTENYHVLVVAARGCDCRDCYVLNIPQVMLGILTKTMTDDYKKRGIVA
mgnify:CR=1 FL=1